MKRKEFVRELELQDYTKEYQRFLLAKAKELASKYEEYPCDGDILFAGDIVLDIITGVRDFED